MQPSASFKEQRVFERLAHELVRLPQPGEEPLAHLLPEARWRELLSRVPDAAAWLAALSQVTGVYFFPSREWVPQLLRYLRLLGVRRLMEAGAGRGYLTGALAPLAEAGGLAFKAIDKGQAEFQTGLPVHPRVEVGDVFTAVYEFKPEVVLYAWPPPGQSLAKILTAPALRYLIVVGEAAGGATGDPQDWQTFPHKISPALRRYGRGRTGPGRHEVTIFWGRGGG